MFSSSLGKLVTIRLSRDICTPLYIPDFKTDNSLLLHTGNLRHYQEAYKASMT